MLVSVCTFKRTRRAETEWGIAIQCDGVNLSTVIDQDGNRVNLIYSYEFHHHMGCFDAVLPLNQSSGKAHEPQGV